MIRTEQLRRNTRETLDLAKRENLLPRQAALKLVCRRIEAAMRLHRM